MLVKNKGWLTFISFEKVHLQILILLEREKY